MLTSKIIKLINKSDGWIGFDKFMFEALFCKGYGYYNKPLPKGGYGPFGSKGDFVTAPMMGPWLAMALARNFIELNDQAPKNLKNKLKIREIGAGTGDLAAKILSNLQNCNSLPQAYEIIEINESMVDLQKRNIFSILKEKFNGPLASNIFNVICWKNGFVKEQNIFDCSKQNKISGMVIANELIDSFPTKIFKFIPTKLVGSPLIYEYGVSIGDKNNFLFTKRIAKNHLLSAVKKRFDQSIERGFPWSEPRLGEWCPHIDNWFNQVIKKIDWGKLIVIDYGKERYELDYPTRLQGTLVAYRNHKQITDLNECLKDPGEQDLTTQVDFSSIVETLSRSTKIKLEIKTQAAWMLDSGILKDAEAMFFSHNKKLNENQFKEISSLQNLLSDATMGQSFLVLSAEKFY